MIFSYRRQWFVTAVRNILTMALSIRSFNISDYHVEGDNENF
jgi:hypothetical protein